MFEKMMEYKKTWKLFREWLYENHNLDFHLGKIKNEDLILSIMPFFFDEYNINITPSKKQSFVFYPRKDDPELEAGRPYKGKNRKEALIKGCEKAFEILED